MLDKQVVITNGMAGSGKDTFAEMLDKFIPTVKYSSIDLVKEIATLGGWNNDKSEKGRRLLSDLKMLFSTYNDMPFEDIKSMVSDFKHDILEGEVLLIDIREPHEIERAQREFGAITVLIANINVPHIKSNLADANVFNFGYDYIVKNNGTLEDLEKQTQLFYEYLLVAMGRR